MSFVNVSRLYLLTTILETPDLCSLPKTVRVREIEYTTHNVFQTIEN